MAQPLYLNESTLTTHPDTQVLWQQVMVSLINHGLSDLQEPLAQLVNQAMAIERSLYLQASPWQHSDSRVGHANGFKPKTVTTRVGDIALKVPQVRPHLSADGSGNMAEPWYPMALERGQRSERALLLAMAEMYVQGVSTRKVSAIVEQLIGKEVTSAQVSRAAEQLDETLTAWREGAIGPCAYVYFDARYEKVRHQGQVRDCAVLVAVGVNLEGKRRILGVSVALSEAEAHWRAFMLSLQARGLSGMQMITSDAHPGLAAARSAVWPSVPWQRCQFHLQQNAQAYVPKQDMKKKVASDIRAIFDAPNLAEAERLLKLTVAQYAASAPKLANWMETYLPQGLAVFTLPPEHHKRCRTTNGLERLNREIKRRTRVATIFPNEKSLLRLVTALLIPIDDEWACGKVYLSQCS